MATKKSNKSKRFLVGREAELRCLRACLSSHRSVLLEGPVGVGKTHLALSCIAESRRPFYRIDGDSRYSEQKLTGWFDPPTVMKLGFVAKAFTDGPLVQAMREGGILFINELNRLPEGVQNVLLPALDERRIVLPRIGEIHAKPGFMVIATQNPKEFVATTHLSEAILDRFELIHIHYQSEEEECAIVEESIRKNTELEKGADSIAKASVRLTRATRNHPRIKRGASIRAALSISELTVSLVQEGNDFGAAFREAVKMALPTRIEMDREATSQRSQHEELTELLLELVEQVLADLDSSAKHEKKKS